MSGKGKPVNGNVPHIPNPEEHGEDDVESVGSENEEQGREAEELQVVERPALDAGSRGDSGLDSPLELAIGSSLDSGHDSPLEGAVGGELPSYDVEIASQEGGRIKPEKEDLFRKFFNEEYDQPNPRRRHPDQRPRPQESNINPLGFLQGVGTPLEVGLNKAGAVVGQNIQMENMQGCSSFCDQSLLPREDLHSLVRSVRNDLGDFRPPSDDSRRGLSPGLSSMSFSSRQTTSTDNMQTSPLLYSDSLEGSSEDAERIAQDPPARRRRVGIVAHPILARSKSDHARSSARVPPDARTEYPKKTSEAMSVCSEPSRKTSEAMSLCSDLMRTTSNDSPAGIQPDARTEYHKKKISEAMSVCSEPSRKISEAMSISSDPIPLVRKISKDSSTDSPMSFEDESVIHPELLSHSLESEPCLPMPDIDPEAIANLAALTVAMDDAEENGGEETEEQGTVVPDLSRNGEPSNKPQND